MISEPTGEMRHMDATVILDGLECTCSNVLGGCPRQDFTYWRENLATTGGQKRPKFAPSGRPGALCEMRSLVTNFIL